MIGLVQNSIIIGQGEDVNLVFEIEDKQAVFNTSNTILFAMKDIDGNTKYTYSQYVYQLSEENNTYSFIVELSSALTLSFDVATYFFDITLIADGKKHPLITPPSTIRIERTVGASISGGN